jgi:hypothetical protein
MKDMLGEVLLYEFIRIKGFFCVFGCQKPIRCIDCNEIRLMDY